MMKSLMRVIGISLVLSSVYVVALMHHEAAPGLVAGYASVKIDPARVQLLGIDSEKVIARCLKKTVRTVGIVEVDETRIAHIQTKFNGWIEELYANFVGMPVAQGQPLFSVYSPELLATQEEYLVALQALCQSVAGKFAKEFKKSDEMLVCATRQRLALWDISPEQIDRLEKQRVPSKTLIVRSPFKGIVLDKKAFAGMNVGPGINTYTVADLSRIWVQADIYANDVATVRMGQKAKLSLSSFPGKVFKGNVTFVDYVVEAATRTTRVRFEFDNCDYMLKPGMYATVETFVNMGKVLALPEDALIDTGKRKIVFVAKGEGHFEPREVALGFKAGAYYQILYGVAAGEHVVTSAQFLLDSESRLKAFGRMKGHGVE